MYKGYRALQERFSVDVFEILAFPCNQFGKQEPGTPAEIRDFARKKYGFKGALMAKVDVNGPNAHPLWQLMKRAIPGEDGKADIRWNFAKFLIDQHGTVVKRYSSQHATSKIEKDIAELLEN